MRDQEQNSCQGDCCKDSDLCKCCKQCWCCDCQDNCCKNYSSIKVELVRVIVFCIIGCGLAVAGFFMFYAAKEAFTQRKHWNIEKMTCQQVCGNGYFEKDQDPTICCIQIFWKFCGNNKDNCQNQQQGSLIFVIILSGLFIAIGGWLITLVLASAFKLIKLKKNQKKLPNNLKSLLNQQQI